MTRIRILVAGVGGAGSRIVSRVAPSLAAAVGVGAIDTDAQALAEAPVAAKLQIGQARTSGFGTGGDINLGRVAAEDDAELIRAMLAEVSLAVLVVGLGGGTGTGAAPVILKAARDAGATTLCFATLPFRFEGPQRRGQAERAAARLKEWCDAAIVVPSDRLLEEVGDQGVRETFARADALVGDGIRGICKLLTQPGYVNLGFADLQRVIQRSGGSCALGCGEGRGEDRARRAAAALLAGPLLDGGRTLAGARCLLVSILGGQDLTIGEVHAVMDAICAKIPKECHVSMGTIVDEGWRGRVTVTVVASDQAGEGPVAEAAREAVPRGAGKERPARGRKKPASAQGRFRLDPFGQGRFKGAEPTILEGEDLDIPTFLRREIPVER